MRALAAAAALFVVAACSSTASTPASKPAADAGKEAGADSGPKSDCGHPGDVGNALGVGKFCEHVSDCTSNTKATLCTQLGDMNNYFCTFLCHEGGPADECGAAASCACKGGQCGCYPAACGGGGPQDAGSLPGDASSE